MRPHIAFAITRSKRKQAADLMHQKASAWARQLTLAAVQERRKRLIDGMIRDVRVKLVWRLSHVKVFRSGWKGVKTVKEDSAIATDIRKDQYPEDTEELHERLWASLMNLNGDGSAAEEALKAGLPIYYREKTTPPGLEIKEYPDGRRELVRFSRQGDEVIRIL